MPDQINNFFNYITKLSLSRKLLLLFLLALTLRFTSYITHPYIHRDSVTYLSINYHDSYGDLQTGLDLNRELPPAILYYMRIFSFLGIDVEMGYRICSIFLYSFALFGFFYICRKFLSEQTSLFAVFCYVCHPKFIGYSHGVLRETLAIPFMIAAIALFFLYFDKKKVLYLILSGVSLSICYMSRIEYGVAFITALILFCMLATLRKIPDIESRKEIILPCLYVVLAMIPLVLAAYLHLSNYNSHWDPFAYMKIKWFLTGSI